MIVSSISPISRSSTTIHYDFLDNNQNFIDQVQNYEENSRLRGVDESSKHSLGVYTYGEDSLVKYHIDTKLNLTV